MEGNSYLAQFQTLESIEELKRKIDMTNLDDAKLLIIEPCGAEEHVFMKASKGEADFVYLYEDVFKELNIQFPFLNLE